MKNGNASITNFPDKHRSHVAKLTIVVFIVVAVRATIFNFIVL